MSPDDSTRAADILEASLEDRRVGWLSKTARVAASFVIAVFSGGSSDEGLLPGYELVVRRKDSGAEVLRVRAGTVEEADRMLADTRRDLAVMTVEQFVREWRLVE